MALVKDDLKSPAVHFWWDHNPASKATGTASGFKLRWQEENGSQYDVSKELSGSVLNPGPVENITSVLALMNMVRESKRRKVDEKLVWKSLLKKRWSAETIKDKPCLNEDQQQDLILKVTQELDLGSNDTKTWILDQDLAFGKELFSIMKSCSDVQTLHDHAKMSLFFRHLVTDHNLNTVIASTMRNIQPMAEKYTKNLKAINMWYDRLDKRYNLSLGPVILPLMKTDNLTQLAKLDPPYLKDFKANIDGHHYDPIYLFYGKIPGCKNVDAQYTLS